MTDEIKKNKPGPQPKVALGESVSMNPAPKRQRVPMHGDANQQIPSEAKDPAFHFRCCADYGKGKI